MLQQQTATTGVIELLASDIVDINKKQMEHGRKSDGSKITPSYRSKEYAEDKYYRNPLPGKFTPDLYDTGSFYDSIRFFIEGSKMIWEATDSKAPALLAKYGSVLGIYDGEPLRMLRKNKIYPLMIQVIKAETGL